MKTKTAATTLVKAAHDGAGANGSGGCHTRWSNHGRCSGERTAQWLNNLGPDSDVYVKSNHKPITNGEVRENWLKGNAHIVRVTS